MRIEYPSPAEIDAAKPLLAGLLCEAVAGGAPVGFLPPLRLPAAGAYWRGVRDSVANGARILLVARGPRTNGIDPVLGTVQLALAGTPDARHRGELQMLIVARAARRQGIGRTLIRAAEQAAVAEGRSLLLLNAREGDAGAALFRSIGWSECGRVADHARNTDGAPSTAVFFQRRLPADRPINHYSGL